MGEWREDVSIQSWLRCLSARHAAAQCCCSPCRIELRYKGVDMVEVMRKEVKLLLLPLPPLLPLLVPHRRHDDARPCSSTSSVELNLSSFRTNTIHVTRRSAVKTRTQRLLMGQ